MPRDVHVLIRGVPDQVPNDRLLHLVTNSFYPRAESVELIPEESHGEPVSPQGDPVGPGEDLGQPAQAEAGAQADGDGGADGGVAGPAGSGSTA